MIVQSFTFNGFQENTYVVSDDSLECVIFDPGCSNGSEEQRLQQYILDKGLKPVRLINTHCHIDHILGNKFVSDTYNLPLEAHAGEVPVLESGKAVSQNYGIPYTESPPIAKYLEENDQISFGHTTLKALFTPGHSPASLSFYHADSHTLIAGDVLFQGSIGRTDLPGGNFETLIRNIKEKLLVLPDETTVYSGHGPATTIGYEREHNQFLQ